MRHIAAASLFAAERRKARPPFFQNRKLLVSNIALASLLGACTVATPPVVSADGSPLQSSRTITLNQPAKDAAPRERELFVALGEAFAERGYANNPAGSYTIEYSITERSAAVGIAHEAPSGEKVAPKIVSPDRVDKRILRECNAQRLRINLVAYPKGGSGDVKRAHGEMDDCGFTSESVKIVVDAMMDALFAG